MVVRADTNHHGPGYHLIQLSSFVPSPFPSAKTFLFLFLFLDHVSRVRILRLLELDSHKSQYIRKMM